MYIYIYMCVYIVHIAVLDGSRTSLVEGSVWSRDQLQKDSKTGVHPTVKSTACNVTLQRKVSEDDDDASDSEKMVICEDESTGNGQSLICTVQYRDPEKMVICEDESTGNGPS